MRPARWHHVVIPVSDIAASTTWYARVLGGDVVRRIGVSDIDRRARRNEQVWMQMGDAILVLADADPVERPDDTHFFHYALQVDEGSLETWLEHLRAEGVDAMGPFGHGGAPVVSIYLDDPDGYRMELVFTFDDYETAKAVALQHGGQLGNPTHAYAWR